MSSVAIVMSLTWNGTCCYPLYVKYEQKYEITMYSTSPLVNQNQQLSIVCMSSEQLLFLGTFSKIWRINIHLLGNYLMGKLIPLQLIWGVSTVKVLIKKLLNGIVQYLCTEFQTTAISRLLKITFKALFSPPHWQSYCKRVMMKYSRGIFNIHISAMTFHMNYDSKYARLNKNN